MSGAGLKANITDVGLSIPLHVQPRAKRCEIAGLHNGALKIKVTAPPVDDAANRAIIEFLAKSIGVPKSALRILTGGKSRDKVLQITGLTLVEFHARISPYLLHLPSSIVEIL